MDWQAIRTEYETTDISLKDLAAKHGISDGTMRSRKNREKWQRGNANKRKQRNATQGTQRKKKSVATESNAAQEKKQEAAVVAALAVSEQLTEKQKLFCLHYLRNRNATQAAINAGYSKESAHSQGYENLRKPAIAAELRRLKGATLQDLYVDMVDVYREYLKIAFSDLSDVLDFGSAEQYVYVEGQRVIGPDGNYKTESVPWVRIRDAVEVDASMIAEIKQTKDGLSVKLHDKLKALAVLAEHLGITQDQHRQAMDKANFELSRQRLEVSKADAELRRRIAEETVL